MIEINLLPEEYRKKVKSSMNIAKNIKNFHGLIGKYKAVKMPSITIAAGGALLVALVLFLYPVYQGHKIKILGKQWKAIEKDFQQVEAAQKELKELQDKESIVKKILKSRILWSQKLNVISDSMPDEIQLTEIATRIETKDDYDRDVLVVSGLVPSYSGERAIGDLIKGLRENNDFVGNFPLIEPPSTQTSIGGIKTFILKCYMPIDEQKAKKKGKMSGKANEPAEAPKKNESK